MKKQLFILGLGFLFVSDILCAFAYYNFTPYYPHQGTLNHYHYPNYPRYNVYNSYNPYTAYRHYNYNPYYNIRTINPYYGQYYNNMNYATVSRLKQRQRMRKLKRKLKNQISWFNKNNGALTGYSMPVSKDTLNNYPQQIRPITSSPTCNTDLWENGNGSGGKHTGLNSMGSFKDDRQTGARTGVTIIYD